MSDDKVQSADQAYQEHFRGSQQEIRRRLSVYLALLEEAGVRDLDGDVLDIGFGRGEWLGLLAEHGYRTVGVDVDPGVVAAGQEAGLTVSVGDALEAVAARPDASLAAVTAFHVVEHLDPRRLGDFLSQIHRVLAPGGLVVLETPNPENVTVGAASFYIDPDHERPVPPQLLDFYARSAGFARPWIARVNRASLDAPLAEVPDDMPGALQINAVVYAVNGMLFAAPDYAVLAQKQRADGEALDGAAYGRLFGEQPADLASHRRLAAEQAAGRVEAENARLRARLTELDLERAQALDSLHAAKAAADDAVRRGEEAVTRQAEADAQLRQAREDFSVVASSLSWRMTAPLRTTSALARGSVGGKGPGAPGLKRFVKLAIGHPMRWALARPRLGSAIDRGLAHVPGVERRVRVAVHETTVELVSQPSSASPGDVSHLSESARSVVVDLERAFSGGEG